MYGVGFFEGAREWLEDGKGDRRITIGVDRRFGTSQIVIGTANYACFGGGRGREPEPQNITTA